MFQACENGKPLKSPAVNAMTCSLTLCILLPNAYMKHVVESLVCIVSGEWNMIDKKPTQPRVCRHKTPYQTEPEPAQPAAHKYRYCSNAPCDRSAYPVYMMYRYEQPISTLILPRCRSRRSRRNNKTERLRPYRLKRVSVAVITDSNICMSYRHPSPPRGQQTWITGLGQYGLSDSDCACRGAETDFVSLDSGPLENDA